MPKNYAASVISKASKASARIFKGKGKKTPEPEKSLPDVPPEKRPTSDSPIDNKDKIRAEKKDELNEDVSKETNAVDNVTKIESNVHNYRPRQNEPGPAKVMDAEEKNLIAELEEQRTTKGNYSNIFALEDNERMTQIRYGDFSYYTTNAINIFEKLHESHLLLSSNNKFMDKHLEYYSKMVDLGYAVMYYIRILQIRDELGANTYDEDKFFRAFTKKFKLEEIPCVGFLEVDFAFISKYKPKDARIRDYLLPQLEPMMTHSNDSAIGLQRYNYQLSQSSRYVQPHVPALYEYVWMFCNRSAAYALDNVRTYQNTFVPRQGNAGADFLLGGINIQGAANNHVAADGAFSLLASPGLNHRTAEGSERLAYIRDNLQRSGFCNRGPGLTNNDRFTSIFEFLRMPNNNWNWFSIVIDAMTIHASMFNGMTRFANIPTTGSMELGMFTHLNVNELNNNSASQVRIDLVDGTVPWFPDLFRHSQGSVTSYEPGAMDIHFYQARHCGMNAAITLRFNSGDHADAGNRQTINLYQNATGAANAGLDAVLPARWGPYWSMEWNGNWMDHRILGARNSTRADMPLFDRRRQLIREFYAPTGKNHEW